MGYAIDTYIVFDHEKGSLFNGSHGRARALYCAVNEDAEKVWHFVTDEDTHTDISEDLAIEWLDRWVQETREVPAILPDFIKQHLPPEAIEAKRKQQLGRV